MKQCECPFDELLEAEGEYDNSQKPVKLFERHFRFAFAYTSYTFQLPTWA
jgi:hypothetical protein